MKPPKGESKRGAFTADEADAALRAYASGSWAAVFELFPEMNRHTVIARVQRLPGYRHRRPDWTLSDERKVVSLWNSGFRAKDIAKQLGRSPTAVEMKIGDLRKRGVVLKRKISAPVTAAQKRVIAAQADQLVEVLVQRFGYAPATIRSHVVRAIMTAPKRGRRQQLSAA